MAHRPFGIAAKSGPVQLDLFAPIEQAELVAVTAAVGEAVETEPPVPGRTISSDVADKLRQIRAGEYAGHPSLYDENSGSRSRLLHCPMRLHDGKVYLMHPGLANEPWLGQVEAILGYRPEYDDCVSDHRRIVEQWHATDLCTKSGWRELIATVHLTNAEAVAHGVVWMLGRSVRDVASAIDIKTCRLLLEAAGVPETGAADDDILIDAVLDDENRRGMELIENVWDRLHAFERGLVRFVRDLVVIVDQRAAA